MTLCVFHSPAYNVPARTGMACIHVQCQATFQDRSLRRLSLCFCAAFLLPCPLLKLCIPTKRSLQLRRQALYPNLILHAAKKPGALFCPNRLPGASDLC